MTPTRKRAHGFNEAWKLSYNVNEACIAIGVGRTRLYQLINSGQLPCFHLDGRTLIRADVVRAFRPPQPRQVCEPAVIAEAPPPIPACGVYLLMDSSGVAYVGRSTKVRSRLSEHRRSGREFDEARVIECDVAASVWLEKELIRVLQPTQNLMRYRRQAAASEKSLRRGGLQ